MLSAMENKKHGLKHNILYQQVLKLKERVANYKEACPILHTNFNKIHVRYTFRYS